MQDKMLKFAKCMRDNGVDLIRPDRRRDRNDHWQCPWQAAPADRGSIHRRRRSESE
jgi:hypothetical protein